MLGYLFKKNEQKCKDMIVENGKLKCLRRAENHLKKENTYSYSWDLVQTIGFGFDTLEEKANRFKLLIEVFGDDNIQLYYCEQGKDQGDKVASLSDILKKFYFVDETPASYEIEIKDNVAIFKSSQNLTFATFNFNDFIMKISKGGVDVITTGFMLSYINITSNFRKSLTYKKYETGDNVPGHVKFIVVGVANTVISTFYGRIIQNYAGLKNLTPTQVSGVKLDSGSDEIPYVMERIKANYAADSLLSEDPDNIDCFWKTNTYIKSMNTVFASNIPLYYTRYNPTDNCFMAKYIKNTQNDILKAFKDTYNYFEICEYNSDIKLDNGESLNISYCDNISITPTIIKNSLESDRVVYFKESNSDACIKLLFDTYNDNKVLYMNGTPLVCLDTSSNVFYCTKLSINNNGNVRFIDARGASEIVLFGYKFDEYKFVMASGYTCDFLTSYIWKPYFIGFYKTKAGSVPSQEGDYSSDGIEKLFGKDGPQYMCPYFYGYCTKEGFIKDFKSELRDPAVKITYEDIFKTFEGKFDKILIRILHHVTIDGSQRYRKYDFFMARTNEFWKIDYYIRYNYGVYRGFGLPSNNYEVLKGLFSTGDFVTLLAWDEVKSPLQGGNKLTFALDTKNNLYPFKQDETVGAIIDHLEGSSYEPENHKEDDDS